MRTETGIPAMRSEQGSGAVLSIGTAARIVGVSVQTLRLYERNGLVLPRKSPGGQRLYSSADIDRIRCIRKAIYNEKLSIPGIRRIQALIPCWDIIQCSSKDRANCEAYKAQIGACWSFKHRNNVCARLDCRECVVYTTAVDCSQVKRRILDIRSRDGEHSHTSRKTRKFRT